MKSTPQQRSHLALNRLTRLCPSLLASMCDNTVRIVLQRPSAHEIVIRVAAANIKKIDAYASHR